MKGPIHAGREGRQRDQTSKTRLSGDYIYLYCPLLVKGFDGGKGTATIFRNMRQIWLAFFWKRNIIRPFLAYSASCGPRPLLRKRVCSATVTVTRSVERCSFNLSLLRQARCGYFMRRKVVKRHEEDHGNHSDPGNFSLCVHRLPEAGGPEAGSAVGSDLHGNGDRSGRSGRTREALSLRFREDAQRPFGSSEGPFFAHLSGEEPSVNSNACEKSLEVGAENAE